MATPTTLVVRTFSDRAEGLSHFLLHAGEAPRLLAFDDSFGCPIETALSALEWTGAVGILQDDDLLHAGRLTSETAAAVVERKTDKGRRYVYLGPRLDAPPMDVWWRLRVRPEDSRTRLPVLQDLRRLGRPAPNDG